MKPCLLIIDGPMGSGKTSVSKIIHERIKNVALLGLDRIKWTLSGFDRTSEQNAMTGKVVQAMARTYLENGASVLLDEGFGRAEVMQPYLDLAAELKVPYFIYQLDAPDNVLLERLGNRPTPEQARTPISQERTMSNIATHRNHKYEHAKTIDSTELAPDLIADLIIQDLKANEAIQGYNS